MSKQQEHTASRKNAKFKALTSIIGGLGLGMTIGATIGFTVWDPIEGLALGFALGAGAGGVLASLYYFQDIE